MARFSIYKVYMPMHDGLVVRPCAMTLISVSLIGGTQQLVFAIALPQVTAQLLALEPRYAVTTAGAGGGFVASNSSSSIPVELGGQC